MPIDFGKLLKDAADKREKESATDSRGILFGSGITKKVAEAAEKKLEKQQQQTSHLQGEPQGDLLDQPQIVTLDADVLPSTMMDTNIILDEDQMAAVEGIKKQKYSCLIGAAGTGKTTVTKAMIIEKSAHLPQIDLNRARRPDDKTPQADTNIAVCITSFTGKAVQNIKRALPKEYHPLCDTIHGTLGYAPTIEEYLDKETNTWKEKRVFRPTFTALNLLPFKLCVIDEASMVPIYLWNELLAALPEDCEIVLVGDINQLTPVQGRSVFGFAMAKWPTYALTKLHRQAEGDAIAVNAHKILRGAIPENDSKQFIVKHIPDGSLKAFSEVNGIIQHLHKIDKFDPMTDALIVPKNVGNLGQLHFNEKLVQYFNPVKRVNDIPLNPRMIIKAGYKQVVYSVGDKVMLLNNERKLGLTNGMVGVVEEITPNAK
ncbi:MAG: AAA family ATPase, partial [Thermodesulfovibrionia bacterium]|nr:AAA family ATPase [Thermodesulfovibrionia bacterium]